MAITLERLDRFGQSLAHTYRKEDWDLSNGLLKYLSINSKQLEYLSLEF